MIWVMGFGGWFASSTALGVVVGRRLRRMRRRYRLATALTAPDEKGVG